MTYLLDYLFSSTILLTTVVIVLMFLFVGLSFLNPFKSKPMNMVYKGFMFVVACLPMILPTLSYYGFANGFKKISIGKTTLCLFEQYERGGESGTETVSRLHILDIKTGEKKERFYTGHSSELINQKGDSVFYQYNKTYVMYHAALGKVIYEMDAEGFSKKFNALKTGVETISSNQNSSYTALPLLQINAKNGIVYWFEPFSYTLHEKEPNDIDKNKFYINNYSVTSTKTIGQSKYYLSVNSTSNSKRSIIALGEEGKKFISEENRETYLEPFLMAFDTIQRSYVFGHYTSTDKINHWIECKNFDQKTMWKKDKYELHENAEETEQTQVALQVKKIVYYNIGGTVIAQDILTGKKLWITKL